MPVIVEQIYNAPIEKVWQALTNKHEMKEWYFALEKFEPVAEFEFEFTGGREGGIQYVHQCRITQVVDGWKIAHSWDYKGYAGHSIVTFELFEEGSKTRLKLTHAGIESFLDNPDFARQNFEAGWHQIIGTNLKNYVEKV